MSKALAELLVKDRIITAAQFAEVEATRPRQGYVRSFIERKYVSETKLLYFLSQKFGLPSINLDKFEVSPDVLKLVPTDMAARHQVIPIQANQKGILVVALADPTFLSQLESLKFATKFNVEAVLTTFSAFDNAFSKYFGSSNFISEAISSYKKEKERENTKTGTTKTESSLALEMVQVHEIDQGSIDQDQPVITLVNGILSDAIRKRASDIHIEPYEKRFRVRLRVDGTLQEVHEIPNEMRRAVIARVKIMSRMDIGESRVAQDGRIKLRMGRTEIDFRVNSVPTIFGEKVVLRLLSKDNLKLDLAALGFEPKQLSIFRKGIEAPQGMVLVTGPTGSGKTTTLYSALAELNKISDNISTAEDPVEYNFEGINQVQVNTDVGMTFANVLRAFLRQDPDSILVGEIRDYETAEVAIQAALTGHLVLSTLHTNDAPSTVIRMTNMGVEPFLVTACVNTIVAQRLIRTLCQKCKTPYSIPQSKLTELGFTQEESKSFTPHKGVGCMVCNKTGYKGRAAIYEVLDFTPALKDLVLKGGTLLELRQAAINEGMSTLRRSALNKVMQGYTSLEEALSMTLAE